MAYTRVDKDKVIHGCRARLSVINDLYDKVEAEAREMDHRDRRALIKRMRYFGLKRMTPLEAVAKVRSLKYKFGSDGLLDGYVHRFQHAWILKERKELTLLLALCIRSDSSRVELSQNDIQLLKWDQTLHDDHFEDSLRNPRRRSRKSSAASGADSQQESD